MARPPHQVVQAASQRKARGASNGSAPWRGTPWPCGLMRTAPQAQPLVALIYSSKLALVSRNMYNIYIYVHILYMYMYIHMYVYCFSQLGVEPPQGLTFSRADLLGASQPAKRNLGATLKA